MPKPARHDGPARIGRFTILDRIGAGGMGELFLAWDPQLDRKLAIKLVHTRASGQAAEQRLRLEAKALAQLSHPNIVQVFEVGTHTSRVYVAMEFVEGQSLRDWLAALELDGAKRVAAIIDCFVAAGRGLEAVHGAGLIHRDFKPSNVVVGDDGRVRIIDFGLASELDDDDETEPPGGPTTPVDVEHGRKHWDSTLTDTGVLLGTPRYMAPEQWRGRPGDQGSDQFGYCVALFEALYGVHPFERPDVDFAEAIKRGAVVFPVRRPELVPGRVREAIARGLSADPSLRFTSMSELLELVAPPPSSGRRALLAGIGLVLAAGVALAWLLLPEPDAGGPSMLTHMRREALATRDLVRVEQRVAELSAQGQTAEADATFAAFAELPDYAATTALGRGWLNHASRLAARGDSDGELDAYGAAYLSAEPDTQREALFGLARVFTRTRQWSQLRAALDTMASLDTLEGHSKPLDEAQSAELLGMRVTEMVARRDLADAARALGSAAADGSRAIHPALASTIAELARITPTEHELDGYELRLAPMPGLDLDDDGVEDLLVFRPGVAQLSVLGSASPTLAPLASIELSEAPGGLAILPNVDEPLLSLRHGTRLSLHRLDIGETDRALTLTQLFEFDQNTHWPSRWTSGDLDGNGHIEAYASLSPQRRLLVANAGQDPATWVHGDPHPATSAADSVPSDLVVGDLDGDGRPELAVAVGEWSAYDLRILGVPADAGVSASMTPTLELLGRRKLGTVQSLALFGAPSGTGKWLAVGVSNLYPSRRVFPNPPANGVPGVYVFAWDGKRLEQIAFVDAPAPNRIYAGDFNADGLDDLALATHARGRFDTTVLVQTTPGAFEPMMLVELWPIGVIDRDHDGDDELLVLDTSTNVDASERPHGGLYVLGSGDGQLPSLAYAEPMPGQSVDLDVEDALGASIARAEDLATIGLSLRSAAELRKLARVADPELAAHLWVRAAELLEAQGHKLEAADLYAQASTDPQQLGMRAGPTRRKAMRLYEEVHRFRAAADMAASALELMGSEATLQVERDRLEALAKNDPELMFDFDTPLDDGWIVDPLAVRRRGGRLELSLGGAEQGIVARRELQWSGGRLALEVDLEVERIEWSSEISVELRPLDGGPDASLGVGAMTRGGGGLYQLSLKCAGNNPSEPGAKGYPISQPHAELPEDGQRFRLRAELVPGRTWCTADGSGVHVETMQPDPGLAPGRYELVIRGSQMERWGRATASIDRIVITGGGEVSESQPALLAEHIARDLAEGRMEAALASLHDPSAQLGLDVRDQALLSFIALDELGQPDRREAALIAAIGHCDDPRSRVLVGRLLRQRPEHLGPDLRRLCGVDDYFAILLEVWGAAIYQHPDSATIGRVLTTQTAELERWQPRDPADRHVVLTLLCARARARLSLGTPGPNRADLERAVELGDRWLAEVQAVGQSKLATQLGWCRVDLAAERLDRGEADGAIETLRETLRRSPTPEILADMLTIDPRFVSLRERAAWRELIDPARAGARLHEPTAPQ
jgi:predicted Ser/Thr protein kinase